MEASLKTVYDTVIIRFSGELWLEKALDQKILREAFSQKPEGDTQTFQGTL